MRWWVLLWAVLIVGALALYGVLGLRLWRQGRALTRELAEASARLAEVSEALDALADRPAAAAPPTPVPVGAGRRRRGRW